MERRRPSFELIALVTVFVLGAVLARWWTQRKDAELPPPQTEVQTMGGRTAGNFVPEDLDGQKVSYQHDGHPMFIILTAVGCSDRRARVPLDKTAVEAAHKAGVPVWNLLVYANQASGKQFFSQFSPTEDRILVDPGGAVSVNQLGGSDASCWIMLDGQGVIRWQGPGTPDNIEKALKSVT